jgi:hypothetical protein
VSAAREHAVERLVICRFAELLAARTGTRFRRPIKLDIPTKVESPAKMSDYLLQDAGGHSLLVEMKRWLPAEKEHKVMCGRMIRAVREMRLTRALDIWARAFLWSREAIPAPRGKSAGAKAMQWCEFRERVKRSILKAWGTGRQRGWRRKGFSSFSVTAEPSRGTSIYVSAAASIARIRVNPSVVRNEFVKLLRNAGAQLEQAAARRPDSRRVLLLLDLTDNPGILGGRLQDELEEDKRLSQSARIDQMWVAGLDPMSPGINQFWPLEVNHTGEFFSTRQWRTRNRTRFRDALHEYFALNLVKRIAVAGRSA